MDEASNKGIWPHLWPIVTVALVTVGVLVNRPPLQTARPTETELVKFAPMGKQDVEARLWEDPIAAVERHKESERAAGNGATDHKQKPPL